jgi:hypothetical protein
MGWLAMEVGVEQRLALLPPERLQLVLSEEQVSHSLPEE